MGLVKEAGIENLNTIIGCKLENTKEILDRTLESAVKTSPVNFQIRENTIREIRNFSKKSSQEWSKRFDGIAAIESDLKSFLDPASDRKSVV